MRVKSVGEMFAPHQGEELQIRYLEALKTLPAQPGLDLREQIRMPKS